MLQLRYGFGERGRRLEARRPDIFSPGRLLEMKQILLTNDDGIQAPGLKSLEESMASIGEVTVVAPDREMSGASQSISVHAPLRVRQLDERHYAVSGTPADTVIIALYHLLPQKPNLVISGINPGGNLGESVVYSGTVAAAMEAVLHGVPAIAISLATRKHLDFSSAATFAAQLAAKVLEEGLPEGVMLNVNVPRGEVSGVRLTRQSQKISQNLVLEKKDPRGRPYYWLDETVELSEVEPDSDYAAILAHEVSVTPLHVDRTHYPSLNHLSRWLPALELTVDR
ncbi:MAG: 5'/3'-nucleotidase SurE [Terriglobia bacterium]